MLFRILTQHDLIKVNMICRDGFAQLSLNLIDFSLDLVDTLHACVQVNGFKGSYTLNATQRHTSNRIAQPRYVHVFKIDD